MFPPTAAIPVRSPIPVWTIATGAIALVVVLLIGLVALAGRTPSNATTAPIAPGADTTPQSSALEPSLLTASDFGPDWSTTRTTPDGPLDLVWSKTCFQSADLRAPGIAGISTDISYLPAPTRSEEGWAQSSVRAYASTDAAAAQVRARTQDGFRTCVAEFDTLAVTCSCGIVPHDVGVQPVTAPAGSQAVMYQDTLAYEDHGPQTYHVIRAYISEGKFFGVLTVARKNTTPDRVQFDELLRTFQQRLLVHAPT